MGWQWALPLPRCWLIFSWVTMKGFGWKTIRPPVLYFTDVMLTILFVYLTLNMTLLCFLTTSMTDIPTYVSPWKKRGIKKIPFLDVLIDNSQPQSPITRVFRKKTFIGLLTNYFSFTPFSYKLGLIRTLVDRTYKINNTWEGFNEDIKKLLLILRKSLFPSHNVERVIRQYITKTQTLSNIPASPPSNSTHFFKLPYVGLFSIVAQIDYVNYLNVIVTILMLS